MFLLGFIRHFWALLATRLYLTARNSSPYFAVILVWPVTIRFLFQRGNSLKAKLMHILKRRFQHCDSYIRKETSKLNFKILNSVFMDDMSYGYREWANPVAYVCTETSRSGSESTDESESNSDEGSNQGENEDSVEKGTKMVETVTDDSVTCISSTYAVFESLTSSEIPRTQKRKAESEKSENPKKSKSRDSLKILETSSKTEKITDVNIKTLSEISSCYDNEETSSVSDPKLTHVLDESPECDRTDVDEISKINIPSDPRMRENYISICEYRLGRWSRLRENQSYRITHTLTQQNMASDNNTETSDAEKHSKSSTDSSKNVTECPYIITEINFSAISLTEHCKQLKNLESRCFDASKYISEIERQFFENVRSENRNETVQTSSGNISLECPSFSREREENSESRDTISTSLEGPEMSSDILPCSSTGKSRSSKKITYQWRPNYELDEEDEVTLEKREHHTEPDSCQKVYPGLALEPLHVKKDAMYQKSFFKNPKGIALPKDLRKVIQWEANKLRDEVTIPTSDVPLSDGTDLPTDEHHDERQGVAQILMTNFDSAKEDRCLPQTPPGTLNIRHLSDDENVCEEASSDSGISRDSPVQSVLIKFIARREVVNPNDAICDRDIFYFWPDASEINPREFRQKLKSFFRIEIVSPFSCTPISVEEFLYEMRKTQELYYRTLYTKSIVFEAYSNSMTICVIPLRLPQSPDSDYELDEEDEVTLVKREHHTKPEYNFAPFAPDSDHILDVDKSEREIETESRIGAKSGQKLREQVTSQEGNMRQSHEILARDPSAHTFCKTDWNLRKIDLGENKAPRERSGELSYRNIPTQGEDIRTESKMEECPADEDHSYATSAKNVENMRPGRKSNYSSMDTLPALSRYHSLEFISINKLTRIPEIRQRTVSCSGSGQNTSPGRNARSESSKYHRSNSLSVELKDPPQETQTTCDVSSVYQEKPAACTHERLARKQSQTENPTCSTETDFNKYTTVREDLEPFESNPIIFSSGEQESPGGDGIRAEDKSVNKESSSSSSAVEENTESIQQTYDIAYKLRSTAEKGNLSETDVLEMSLDLDDHKDSLEKEQSK